MIMNNKLNTFNRDFLRALHEKLDEVEASEGPSALVTIGFENKYFSTGLDIKFALSLSKDELRFFTMEY